MDRREFNGEGSLEKMCFERNVDIADELRVGVWWEGVTESWSNDRDVRTYGMDRTNASDDFVDRE